MKRIAQLVGIVAMAAVPLAAQQDWQEQVDRAVAAAKAATDKLQTPEMQDQLKRAMKAAQKALDGVQIPQLDQAVQEELAKAMAAEQKAMDQVPAQLEEVQRNLQQLQLKQFDLPLDLNTGALDDLKFKLDGMFAFAPQDAEDRVREARERQQEARERVREQRDRSRESEDRNIEMYRSGTDLVDEHRYERAIENFDRVIAIKWARADGAYYWKAYALNKLGKRDEALAALAEIPKQFPQSRWIGDANALKVEIQQASGNPVSPESQSDEDLKLIAISSLMNAEPERTVPLLEKVLNDPKNNLGLKSRALFVLAQNRSDKAREIVLQYARKGPNPDLQIRAVQYLGTFRSPASQQALAEVYAANNDVALRRAVLRSMATSRDAAHLFAAAKSESNADLRREAIRSLGSMRAVSELSQLYATETAAELKDTILASLMSSRDADKLIEIAKTEKNAELRGDAIRYLGSMHDDKSADAIASLYGSETDKDVKAQIIRTLGSQSAGKQLVAITRNEKDLELKKECVQWLGRMHGSKEATDYLMELINK
jgi:tetratricopeptide (TPR) repeat protein